MNESDNDREVWLGGEDDVVVLPDYSHAPDPADRYESANDLRLLEDRPPHW